jgi:hypothetical protein
MSRPWRATALLITGLVIGTTLAATPAGAHVGGTVSHLVNHLKGVFYTKAQSDVRYSRPTVKLGETIRGTVGEQVRVSNVGEIGVNGQLPRAAPVGLDDDHVVIDGVDDPTGACNGTSTVPTAAPGYLCIYPYSTSNVTPNEGAIWGGGDGTKWGFQVSLDVTDTTIAFWFANWAYRAPLSTVGPLGPDTNSGDGCTVGGQSGC